jgi:hypothetical protein
MTKIELFVTVALATSLLGAGATAVSARSSSPKRAVSPQRGYYDGWLTQEVRHQLVLLPFYSVFDNLEYRVNGSEVEVTLLGQVTQPIVKNSSAAISAATPPLAAAMVGSISRCREDSSSATMNTMNSGGWSSRLTSLIY